MSRFYCPDCGERMKKIAFRTPSVDRWVVGWMCKCSPKNENIEIYMHDDDSFDYMLKVGIADDK